MARADVCDKCGKIVVKRDMRFAIDGHIPAGMTIRGITGYTIKEYDLCEECCETLYRFMEGVDDDVEVKEEKIDDTKPMRCFCGGEAKIDEVNTVFKGIHMYRIYCPKCHASAESYRKPLVISDWNRKVKALQDMEG